MLKNKLIDGIIKEPIGGAHSDPEKTFANVKKEILNQLSDLQKLTPEKRLNARIKKFGEMGVYNK